jgi:alpha-mannosidase
VLATTADASVWLGSPDVALFTVGDIVRGRWQSGEPIGGGRLFSYVLNNYWRVNYRGEQAGALSFRYAIASGRALARDAAYHWGWQARQPLYAQRLSLQEFRQPQAPYHQPAGGTLASVAPEQVALSTLSAARHAPGYCARLQEISGAAQTAAVRFTQQRVRRAWETDLLEYDLRPLPVEADGSLRVHVPAWGLTTVRVELEAEPA